ncbi:MAG TPA: 30S ribosomal protein S9 [Vicinamibacteria bacterium]|nr:30S ribosomal protein S9 [Vicinamibacteria bacterium]
MASGNIQYYGTGKRKSSIARVYLRPGRGDIRINKRTVDEYFRSEALKMIVKQPLALTESTSKFDIYANIQGGGLTGQAWAMRLGIARALCEFNQELRPRLKEGGFLTRDSRIKERKKYGQPGARKRFQYSKR